MDSPANNQLVNNTYFEGSKSRFRLFRIKLWPFGVYAVLGLVLLVEIVLGIQQLIKPPPSLQPSQPISGGKIALVSSAKEYKLGDEVTVSVKVSTSGNPTYGVDLVVIYDPKVLEATSSSFFEKGTIYSEYPLASLDTQNGVIKVSGIASGNQKGFNGSGTLASLKFKAKSAGNTTLKVDYKKDATNESNIIESTEAKDILDKTYDLKLTVK
ncbi:hypothetical protein HYW42_04265 [Candidatus Daviesbacteria bacterium]|nr:hypothetical protein [Candidatus Daviesbacteria bacterium]